MPISVVVDHRERPSGVPDRLASMDGIELSFAELEVGDYLVNEDVVLERKSIKDFGNSIIDTRVFRQASRLNRSPHRAALLVEGWLSMKDTAVPRAAMQGAMISLALIFDIPVLHAIDRDESARLIAYAARQLGDPSPRATVWRHHTPKKPWTRRLHVLQSLPGVGRERAERLLERFGNGRTLHRCERSGALSRSGDRSEDSAGDPVGRLRKIAGDPDRGEGVEELGDA